MAVGFVQSKSTFGGGGGSVTIVLPGVPAVGSLLILALSADSGGTGFTVPAGWTLIQAALSGVSSFATAFYWKISAGAADQSIACSVAAASNCAGAVGEYSGARGVVLGSTITNAITAPRMGIQLGSMGPPATGFLVTFGTGSILADVATPRHYTLRETLLNRCVLLDRLTVLPAIIGTDPGVEILPTQSGTEGVHLTSTFTVPPNTLVSAEFDVAAGGGGPWFFSISFDADAGANLFVGGAGHYTTSRTTPNDASNHSVYGYGHAFGEARVLKGTLTAPGATGTAYDPSAGWYGDLGPWTAGQVWMAAASGAGFTGEPGGGYWARALDERIRRLWQGWSRRPSGVVVPA